LIDERLRVLIYHIRDTAAEIGTFVAMNNREDVQANLFAERGLIMSLYMIADLATRVQTEHPDFVAALPEVPWKDIRGLRNRIAHGYFEVDPDIIWHAAVEEVPTLAKLLVERLDLPQIGS
jgi:uncharacterized protein with HEPN domain